MGRKIVYRELDSLQPNPDNAKLHEIGGIAQSMTRFGLIDVPTLDERTGMLVAGHGRIEALVEERAAGKKPPAGVGADGDDWLVPVLRGWASRNDDEAAAAAIALNAWVPRGGWDVDGLTAVLRRLSDTDLGLLGVGYSDRDLGDLLKTNQQWDPTGHEGTARREASIDELAANYRNKQVRTMVLDYPLSDYQRVVALTAEARKRYQVPGNAELLMALLRRWDHDHPAVS